MGISVQPRSARGTRDFSPGEMRLRNGILQVITAHFRKYGYEQIETPAIENLETLMGKYGEEGDNLIFKILNSGDFLRGVEPGMLASGDSRKLTPAISEKALRYDLTVPFARYVVQHRNDIHLPFRRFQIQPVWRADKPQKGRYREFYQCDADVIGSSSLLNETELIALVNDVFEEFGIRATVKVNNRKVLYGFCEACGIADRFMPFTVLLDKLDKKPWDELSAEFREEGFSDSVVARIKKMVGFSGKELNSDSLQAIENELSLSETGRKGLEELREMSSLLAAMEIGFVKTHLDLSLARGLNYYTGAIMEVVAIDHQIGSVCGGGRYDNLTGIFGWEGVSGVGISFGIDRIFDILKETDWAPDNGTNVMVIFANFGLEEMKACLPVVHRLRKHGITAMIYPDSDKLKKQFKYADQRGATHMVTVGPEELVKGIFRLKELASGQQHDFSLGQLINHLIQ